ncbi:hypothetical protein [Sphingosinithalassobacter sp. CS137]|uniref:hypothetical protein n=1 Tax=Sphingosinithalassobacter sp. CS137 TaxID=2762748 RepID=UPI00165DE6D8|nr:hypothetical protein [Sphingosinithalassobacter sp. CS137]
MTQPLFAPVKGTKASIRLLVGASRTPRGSPSFVWNAMNGGELIADAENFSASPAIASRVWFRMWKAAFEPNGRLRSAVA